jgi:hypothetical protein
MISIHGCMRHKRQKSNCTQSKSWVSNRTISTLKLFRTNDPYTGTTTDDFIKMNTPAQVLDKLKSARGTKGVYVSSKAKRRIHDRRKVVSDFGTPLVFNLDSLKRFAPSQHHQPFKPFQRRRLLKVIMTRVKIPLQSNRLDQS